MSIGIYLSSNSRLGSHREEPPGFINRYAQRIVDAVTQSKNPDVRGHIVASDYLVQALLRHSYTTPYTLITRPWMKTAVQAALKGWSGAAENASICTTDDIRLKGIESCGISSLFTPLPISSLAEGVELTQRIRDAYSATVIPATILLHGLSIHKMLVDFYFRIMLEGSYSCDALVLSSQASKIALRNILDTIASDFKDQHNTHLTFEGSLEVIPLAIDTNQFVPGDKRASRRVFALPEKAFILLYVGKLSPLKADLLPLINVFANLVRESKRRLCFVIAGSDESGYARLLRCYVEQQGLKESVRILESVSDQNKPKLMVAADIFVSPSDSLQESFGLTPVEAMSCGVPQIVSSWSGYKETVEHGVTGFAVPTYWTQCDNDLIDSGVASGWMFDHLALGQSVAVDSAEMYRHVRELLNNPDLLAAMSQASRVRALSKYSYEAVAEQYRQLWIRQHEVALRTTKKAFFIRYTQPKYFQSFGHYASHIIVDDTKLVTTAGMKGGLGWSIKYASLPGFLNACHVLDEVTLNRMMDCFDELDRLEEPVCPGDAGVTVGRLLNHVNVDGSKRDYMLRHVMWLIKYGYLRPLYE